MKSESFYIGADNRASAFDITYSSLRNNRELVIFCHGYKGFKDWGPWNLVAERFAKSGFDFLKFNFSHNGGTKDDPIDFPDTEAFAKNTYSKELFDLEQIVDRVYDGIEVNGEKKKYDRVHLIGHSRGGGIAILAAAKFSTIDCLVTWAAVSDFGKRFDFDLEKWKEEGVVHIRNSRTGQMLPHNYSFYEDYLAHREALDIPTAAQKVRQPWLIAHGGDDEAVCISNADYLMTQNPNAHLAIVEETGHTFGGSHPQKEDDLPEKLEALANLTVKFLKS